MRLQAATGAAVRQTVNAVPIGGDTELVRSAYSNRVASLVSGGQRAAARLAAAYIGVYAAPEEDLDLDDDLDDELLRPGDDKSMSGLMRLWSLVGQGMPVGQAREEAGAVASQLAEGDLHAAERTGLDAGARAAHERDLRWALNTNPEACDWCEMIAEGGFRYHEAETVPFHQNCRCSPIPQFEVGEQLTLELEGEGAEAWEQSRDEAIENLQVTGVSGERAEELRELAGGHLQGIRGDVIDKINYLNADASDFDGKPGLGGWYNPNPNSPLFRSVNVNPAGFAEETIDRAALRMGRWSGDDYIVGQFVQDRLARSELDYNLAHELGHHLDFMLTKDQRLDIAFQLQRDYGIASLGDASSKISEYAGRAYNSAALNTLRGMTEGIEVPSELWCEYKTAGKPREMATRLGRYFEDKLGPNPSATPTAAQTRLAAAAWQEEQRAASYARSLSNLMENMGWSESRARNYLSESGITGRRPGAFVTG